MRLLPILFVLFFVSVSYGQTAGQHSRNMARSGQLYHAPNAGRENVFYSSNTMFPRLQARAAWRTSPGHAANLPMIGLRVSRGPNGVYVTGRRR